MGIMNMVGVIDETDAKDAIKGFVRQAGRKLTENDVEYFFDHSMLVRFHRGAYTCSPGGLLRSRLYDACWEDEVRDELDTCIPTDMLDVIVHGQYPYFVAHRKEERAFWNLLRKQMDDEDASSLLTHYYYMLQDPEYGIKEMVKEFSEDFTFQSLKDANNAMAILTDFSNSIPKFILQGHSSKDVAKKTAPQSMQILDRMRNFSHSTFTEPFVNTNKVGRNDPCPCGSGLKYKKCCGK